MHRVLRKAHKKFKEELVLHSAPIDYLNKLYGSFASEVLEYFELGYCPNNFSTLMSLDIHNELKQFGLLNSESKAFFSDRLVFPIHNFLGELVGFTGRTLIDSPSKYINSPALKGVFDKSRLLFNLHRALPSIESKGFVIITEGPTDVISSVIFGGYENVVCTNGTSLTSHHVELLQNYTSHIRLAFDGDTPGKNASLKAYKLIKSVDPSIEVDFVYLEEAYDLDLFFREGFTIFKVCDALEFRTLQLIDSIDLDVLEEIVRLIETIRPYVDKDVYARKFYSYLRDFGFTYEEVLDEFKGGD